MKKRYLTISFLVLLSAMFFYLKQEESAPKEAVAKKIKNIVQTQCEPERLYGMVVDSMEVVEKKIKPNQNLSQILSVYNVSTEVIHSIAQKSKNIFDLQRIAANKKYALLCSKDSLKKAHYFIYEPNEYEYVVCHLDDSINIVRHSRKIDTVVNTISGVIESSLFETITKNGGRPEFAYNLAEVFKWQIDFYKIQKGDKFKVIFEEILVEGKPVGSGKIIGAYFNHNQEDFYGIAFDQGKGWEYFDNNGKNLQKAFLKAPLKFSRISSRFSAKRFHPVTRQFKAHLGTDYAAPTGTPIQTVGDGVVLEAKYTSANGNYVKIRHDRTYTTQYLHMSKIASGMKPGKRVSQGETIGYVGSTGLATGPHLCFRFWEDGRQVDALKVKIPPTDPVSDNYREEYEKVKEEIVQKLELINYENGEYIASSK